MVKFRRMVLIYNSGQTDTIIYYFASAAVAADSSHMTASLSASWNRFSLPSNFVNGHVSTMWFMVCHWPQSKEGDWVRPNLCKLARHGPWPVQKRFIRDHLWRGRSKPGCRIVGSVTTEFTELLAAKVTDPMPTEEKVESFFSHVSPQKWGLNLQR